MGDAIKNYKFIDALKGWAVLGVILRHVADHCTSPNVFYKWLGHTGSAGVILFFIISTFTLFHSWHNRKNSEKDPTRNFFMRRLFRIVPLFYVAIILYLAIDGYSPRWGSPEGVKTWHIVTAVLFVNGWHPAALNAVVPIGWSVTVEMTMYLLLPFLLMRTTNLRRAILATLICVGITFVSNRLLDHLWLPHYPQKYLYLMDFFRKSWFPTSLPIFSLGIIFFFLFHHFNSRPKQGLVFQWLSGIFLIAVLGALMKFLPLGSIRVNYLYAFVFVFMALYFALFPNFLIVNPLINYLGKISYSAYLLHPLIIEAVDKHWARIATKNIYINFHLFYFIVVVTTGLAATLTYFLIERLSTKAGNAIIRRLEENPRTDLGGHKI